MKKETKAALLKMAERVKNKVETLSEMGGNPKTTNKSLADCKTEMQLIINKLHTA